jgi:threonine dehydratase
VKVEQTAGHGAEVILDGEVVDDAFVRALEVQRSRDLVFVPPVQRLGT